MEAVRVSAEVNGDVLTVHFKSGDPVAMTAKMSEVLKKYLELGAELIEMKVPDE